MIPVLSCKDIYKTFDEPIKVDLLRGISFKVHAGQTAAIQGKSGEGKSTLLHILGTLERPSKGSLWINGEEATSQNATSLRNTSVGFIFQAFHLLEEETVLENVLMPAKIGRQSTHPKSFSYQKAVQLLKDLGMEHRMHFPAKLLSGGEKQRTAIARALLNDPSLILADEPSGNLDQGDATVIHQILIDCAKKYQKAVVIVTHDQQLAFVCDHIYTLSSGKLS